MTNRYASDAQRWEAVQNKDAQAAHAFYYAVKTTGIFCIAGCASRLPNRENTEFFDTSKDAVSAGYRPCKRCRPDDPAHTHIDNDRIVTACRIIERTEEPPSLEILATSAGLSPSHFQRVFTAHVGVSPKTYAQAVRDEKVRAALAAGTPVTRAIFDAGYGAASRFYERSEDVLGMPPKSYKQGGQGEIIYYGMAASELGNVMAAFTHKGICSIEFGESTDELVASLLARFPNADIVPGGPPLNQTMADIIAFIDSPKKGLSLPLDIRGTAFQQRVWKELQRIPAGETRTYTQVAEALNAPGSVRAVASACARNRLAVIIPCHRVVRKNGDLAGYYWGLGRKKALLDRESEDQ